MCNAITRTVGLPTFGEATQNSVSVHSLAPEWELKDVNGNVVKSSDFQGKVVIIDFWATWCPLCVNETPNLVELQKKYGAQGLQIIGISMDTSPDSIKSFLKDKGIEYPVVMGNDQTLALFGNVELLPTTFVIDRSGKIVAKHETYTEESVFEQAIKGLL